VFAAPIPTEDLADAADPAGATGPTDDPTDDHTSSSGAAYGNEPGTCLLRAPFSLLPLGFEGNETFLPSVLDARVRMSDGCADSVEPVYTFLAAEFSLAVVCLRFVVRACWTVSSSSPSEHATS
jgi:hypothetical protein